MEKSLTTFIFTLMAHVVFTQIVTVLPTFETDPVLNIGDHADDAVAWIHPSENDSSFLIGMDKSVNGRMEYFNSDGSRYGFSTNLTKSFNNIGLVYSFVLDGHVEDIVAVSNRTDDQVQFFKVDTANRTLVDITGSTALGFEPYGLALYHDRNSNALYCFISQRNAPWNIIQLLVSENTGVLNTNPVRTISGTGLVEGMIVDVQAASLYMSEEDVALWKYSAAPNGGLSRTMVDEVGSPNIPTPDIEGIALYSLTDSTGYLIISVQGNSIFNVYDRAGNNAFLGSFNIGSFGGIDATTQTDGIFASSTAFTSAFPQGVFIAHDGISSSGRTNYKLVSWQSIADSLGLQSNPNYNPRPTGNEVRVSVSAFLEGSYNSGAGTMNDDLRVAGLIPLTEPYSALGYVHVGGGSETIISSILQITGSNAIVDWVIVELRDPLDPSIILATRSALLQRDGDVVDTNGVSPVTFNIDPNDFHVAVRHRNHLGVMTMNSLPLSDAPLTGDFTLTSTATFGSEARKTVGLVQVLWAGDVNFNAEIKYTGLLNDRDPILIAIGGTVPTATVTGYNNEDSNLDGVIKYTGINNDRDIILQNIGGTVPTNVRQGTLP